MRFLASVHGWRKTASMRHFFRSITALSAAFLTLKRKRCVQARHRAASILALTVAANGVANDAA